MNPLPSMKSTLTTNNIVIDNVPGEYGDYTVINTLNDLGTFQSYTSPTSVDSQSVYAAYEMSINQIYSPTESLEMFVGQGIIQTAYSNGSDNTAARLYSGNSVNGASIYIEKNDINGQLKVDNITENITLQFPNKLEGTYTIATTSDVIPFNPAEYDLDEFTNANVDPFAKISDIPVLGYTPVNKAGDTMLGDLILNEDPSTALGAATKQYVDNIAAGINFHAPVTVATDVSLVATYDNGVDGLGATLTGTSVGVLTVDGETPTYLQRVLVWQQADAIENGIYDLTTVGDGTTIYQLTRSADADNSPVGEIQYGDYVLVLSGDTNGGFGFICNTAGTITIGVTPINYVQFNAAQAITAGYGLQELTPNVISINPAETQEKITLTTTGTGAATLVSNTLNIPTLPQATTSVSGYLSSTDFATFTNKENSANKQNSLAVDGTGTKFPTVDAVNAGITNSNYWTKTGNDIKNNTTGGVVKVQGGTGLYYDNAFQTVQDNGTVGFSVQNGGNVVAQYIGCANVSAGFAGVSSSGGLSVVSGGIRLPFVGKTSNYTLGSDYFINCNGTFNITLPAATASNLGMPPGRFYKIKNTGTGVITILTTSSQTIDGALSYTLNPNCFIELTPNVTQWLITSEKGETINRLVVETASPYTLTNTDSGGIIIFTASATLTIPTGLADGFECTFVTLAGVTLTVVSTGNILNNAIGTSLPPQSSFTLKRMIAPDTFIATGNL